MIFSFEIKNSDIFRDLRNSTDMIIHKKSDNGSILESQKQNADNHLQGDVGPVQCERREGPECL